jgi:hypothetical protein
MSRFEVRSAALALAMICTACSSDGDRSVHRQDAAAFDSTADSGAGGSAVVAEDGSPAQSDGTATGTADLAVLHGAFVQHADSIDRKLRRVPALTRQERTDLRRDVNEHQIERARQLGIRVSRTIDPLVGSGRLVRLPDTTDHWVIRELDYSVPYVTPDAQAMLVEISQRFHARLDSLGVPRYRLDITSVLRTPEKQAELRRRNSNASQTESAHEFGTTVDLAYRRFAPPAGPLPAAAHPAVAAQARLLCDSLVVETGRLRGAELQAVLGRVLHGMQREGKLMVRMERRQTVYHITVARRFPRPVAAAQRSD